MTSIIYPVIVGWMWADNEYGIGWLKYLGYVDFAGSGVVHTVGGVSAFWGAMFLGQRWGYDKYREQ